MPVRPRTPRAAAFTLIELLVVIAIIAILASILFPVFARAREKARQTACASNLKQLGVAMQMYSQDFDETLPGNPTLDEGTGATLGFMDAATPRNWAKCIVPYTKNMAIFLCPSVGPRSEMNIGVYGTPAAPSGAYTESTAANAGNTSYCLNGVVSDRALAEVRSPASVVLLQEFTIYTRVAQMRPFPTSPGANTFQQFHHYLIGTSHNQGENRLFCDGHVKWSKKTGMTFTDYGVGGTGSDAKFLEDPAGVAAQYGLTFPAAL
jgi:prepilin-type N-terminal cleavage/methylation domain-containing protein/prepilin-type processing-associated H-X9-DG protein